MQRKTKISFGKSKSFLNIVATRRYLKLSSNYAIAVI